jgi:hypothetical protein
MKLHRLIATAAMLAAAAGASAANSINLANYSVSAVYSLDILNGTSGGISSLEGSAGQTDSGWRHSAERCFATHRADGSCS